MSGGRSRVLRDAETPEGASSLRLPILTLPPLRQVG